jgi:hypothetical protein
MAFATLDTMPWECTPMFDKVPRKRVLNQEFRLLSFLERSLPPARSNGFPVDFVQTFKVASILEIPRPSI